MSTKRQEEESFTDYHIRLFENRDEYELTSDDIADLLNSEYGSDYSESKWRKDYSQYLRWKDYLVNKNLEQEIVNKHEEIRIESRKEQIRKQDWNREYNKKIRNAARFEGMQEKLIESVEGLNRDKPIIVSPKTRDISQNKEGLVVFSDWHYGMEIDNRVNKYNKNVFIERVTKLMLKTISYGQQHKIKTLHVAGLGDFIGGLIHVSTRVQANADLIEQITFVSETMAEILGEFANSFDEVVYYNVCGNHARIMANKSDVGIKENFENIIPWFLEARLGHFDNLTIVNEQDGLAEAEIYDSKIVFVHGDYDNVQNSYAKLPQLLGYVPQYIISGHVHHHFEKEFGETVAIVNGSMVGNDDYAMKGRYAAKPSQKFIVFDEHEGLECTYQIRFK